MSSAASIDDILDEADSFTLEDFERESALLVDRFWLEYGVLKADIAAACQGDLHGHSIADAWDALHALEPYVKPPAARPIIDADVAR